MKIGTNQTSNINIRLNIYSLKEYTWTPVHDSLTIKLTSKTVKLASAKYFLIISTVSLVSRTGNL